MLKYKYNYFYLTSNLKLGFVVPPTFTPSSITVFHWVFANGGGKVT